MTTIKLTVAALGIGMGVMTAACTAGTEPHPSDEGTSSEALSSACVQGIQAPYGTQAWRDALQACIDEARASRPAPPPSEPVLDPRPTPGGGQSCSSSIQCINGACTCGAGPNKGASCDGRTPTGADSCSVKCQTCS